MIEDDEIVISIIGRLVPVKNHSFFLDAMKVIFDNTSKKVRAFIVGDGEERDNIESYAKKLNIDFVRFTEEKKKRLNIYFLAKGY